MGSKASDVGDQPGVLAVALGDVLAAIRAATDELQRQHANVQELFDEVGSGASVSSIATTIDFSSRRESLTVALRRLEDARQHARILMFQQLQAEGRSIADIAEVFGISRQRASRLLHGASNGNG